MGNILITGITGYIGSRLAAALLPEGRVYGLVREPLRTTYLPLALRERLTLLRYDGTGESVRSALAASRPGLVYHLAAHYTTSHALSEIPRLLESNLALGAYLLEAMQETGCHRLVYTTTVTVCRTGAGCRPLTLYAATKEAFAALVEFYAAAGHLRAASVALSDTYGPCDRRPKVLNLIRQAALSGEPLGLTAGRQRFDALYIDDVVSGLRSAAEATRGAAGLQRFGLTAAEPRTLRETVELLSQLSGARLPVRWGVRPEPARIDTPTDPAPPGWKPQVPLEEGLLRFWRDAFSEGEIPFG